MGILQETFLILAISTYACWPPLGSKLNQRSQISPPPVHEHFGWFTGWSSCVGHIQAIELQRLFIWARVWQYSPGVAVNRELAELRHCVDALIWLEYDYCSCCVGRSRWCIQQISCIWWIIKYIFVRNGLVGLFFNFELHLGHNVILRSLIWNLTINCGFYDKKFDLQSLFTIYVIWSWYKHPRRW